MSFDQLLSVLRETQPTSGWRLPTTGWKGIDRELLDEAGVEDLYERGVSIPYRLPDGSTLYAKRIAIGGESWYEPKPKEVGGGLIPFGLDATPWADLRADDVLLITEGESDCLAARQHIAELDGHRVHVLGLPGAKVFRPEWARFIRPFATVYVCFDGDHTGRDGAWKVRSACRWVRIVRLPEGRDLRELLQGDGPEALLPLLDQADVDAGLDVLLRYPLSDEQYRSLGLDPDRIHAAEMRLDHKRSKPMTDDPALHTAGEFFCSTCNDFTPFAWDGAEYVCQGCGDE